MNGKIFSPGKLLITSEYAVLDGALALAIPTKLGQEFFFEELDDQRGHVSWLALHQGELWLQAEIDYQRWEMEYTNLPEQAEFIMKVLKQVQVLSGYKFRSDRSYILKTNLQFPPDYGLGSSSTLMNNLAEWAGVDAFELNEMTLGGSGYDIAVAREKTSILYQLTDHGRFTEQINYSPDFKNELLFIHLNQKQNSRQGIEMYRSKNNSKLLIESLTKITEKVKSCQDLGIFSDLMEQHENELANFLGIEKVKDQYFASCPVFVKSLGAWGGDFVMSRKFSGYSQYFSERGFSTLWGWDDLIN